MSIRTFAQGPFFARGKQGRGEGIFILIQLDERVDDSSGMADSDGPDLRRPYRHWEWVLNTPTADEISHLRNIGEDQVRYLIYQEERGNHTGRRHLQGYVELLDNKRMAGCKLFLGSDRIHLTPRPRDRPRQQARDYCGKQNTRIAGTEPYEIGTWRTVARGNNGTLQQAVECNSLDEVVESFPTSYVRYHRGLERLFAKRRVFEIRDKPWVEIYWGPTGTGKSHKAYHENPGAFPWSEPANGANYALGYGGQETIIFDDFDGTTEMLRYSQALKLCDKWPYVVNVQGANEEWRAKKIIFTSNIDPDDWWPERSERSAFARRVDICCEMTDVYHHRRIHPEEDSSPELFGTQDLAEGSCSERGG